MDRDMEIYQLPIPKDVWGSMVLSRLSLKDYIRCSAVCRCWRRIAAENQISLHSLPWVMLSQDEDTHTALFYSLTEGITYNLKFTVSASKSFCTGSTQGCLVLSDGEANFVFNPFSQHTTPLPPQYVPTLRHSWLTPTVNRVYYKKSVLSASSDPQRLLVASLCCNNRLVTLTCSSNDKEWSVFERSPSLSPPTQEDEEEEEVDPDAMDAYLEEVERWSLMDVIFYRGMLHGLSESSTLVRFNNLEDPQQVMNMVPMELPDLRTTVSKPYLVESSCGDLLMVYRIRDRVDPPGVFKYVTDGFSVFKLDDKLGDERRWVAVKSLGDEIIFLGKNSSISVSAKDISARGMKGNCIYFTDDAFQFWPWDIVPRPVFFTDNGVFHLEDGRIESFLPPELSASLKSQPIWVMPNKLGVGVHHD